MSPETGNEFAVMTFCVVRGGSRGSVLFTFSSMWVSEQHFAAENALSLRTSLDSKQIYLHNLLQRTPSSNSLGPRDQNSVAEENYLATSHRER